MTNIATTQQTTLVLSQITAPVILTGNIVDKEFYL